MLGVQARKGRGKTRETGKRDSEDRESRERARSRSPRQSNEGNETTNAAQPSTQNSDAHYQNGQGDDTSVPPPPPPFAQETDEEEELPGEVRKPRVLRNPKRPTEAEKADHKTSFHLPYRSWCEDCVRGG